jgi:hypothetical protein
MSSTAQIVANQKNAQSSTGPRTAEGKDASSQNAIRYGLTAKQVVLSFEGASAFEAMRADLTCQLHPETGLEYMLVDDIAAAHWRFIRVETAQKDWYENETKSSGNPLPALMLEDAIRKFRRYASEYRRAFESAWKKLAALQKERRANERNEPNPPPASQPKCRNEPKPIHRTPLAERLLPASEFTSLIQPRHYASQPIYNFTKRNP